MDKARLEELGFSLYDSNKEEYLDEPYILEHMEDSKIAILMNECEIRSGPNEGTYISFSCLYRLGKLPNLSNLYSLRISKSDDSWYNLQGLNYQTLYYDIDHGDVTEFILINTDIEDILRVLPELTKALIPSLNTKSAMK